MTLWLSARLEAEAQVGEPVGAVFVHHLPGPMLVSTLVLPNAGSTPCQFISVTQVIC